MRLSVLESIGYTLVSTCTQDRDTGQGSLLQRSIESGQSLQLPLLFWGSPRNGKDRRSILFCIHSRGDRVQKSFRGIRSDVNDDPGAGRNGTRSLNVESDLRSTIVLRVVGRTVN